MAWQTPKTNWTSADGVRNTDLNRIEGNILELHNKSMVHADITLYVSTAGNDNTGTGSSTTPYATINKALSMIPKNLNGKTVELNIVAGTYPEDVIIKGFSGPVIITGAYNARVTVNNFKIDGCICVLNTIYILMANRGVTVTNGGVLTGTGSLSIGNAPTSVSVNMCSRVSLTNLISEGAANYAIIADGASHVFFSNMSGLDNQEGILVQNGSIVAAVSNNLNVVGDLIITYSGGRYYTGNQGAGLNTLVDAEVIQ